MYFTVEPPYTYYVEINNYFYLFIRTENENQFYLISDSLFDELKSNDEIIEENKTVNNF